MGMFCKHCGVKLEEDTVVCGICGKKVKEEINVDDIKDKINININNANQNNVGVGRTCNKWVTFWLALFIGGIGGHKLYEGKIGMFFLYLFFCWTGIPVFVAVIDIIVVLCKPHYYTV